MDFSASPERKANASVRSDRAGDAGDHWILGAGGSVSVDFAADDEADEVTLKIRALVSKAGPQSGHAPLDVLVNGHPLVSRFRIPGGGDLPQVLTFAVPGEWLGAENTLELRSAEDSRTMLWLYRVLLESVWDRDAAERALLADAAGEAAFTFATSTRPPGLPDWRPGPKLRFSIDAGQAALPAELSWRGRDGVEATLSFAQEMTGFLGHCRTDAGDWLQLRGDMVDRAEPYEPVWRFTTETDWGTGWHADSELAIHLDTGVGPVERIGWRDQRGNAASIGLSRDGNTFAGYVQKVGEGPIGYRGTAVAAATTQPQSITADLDQAAQAVQRLAVGAVDRFNTWLRDL